MRSFYVARAIGAFFCIWLATWCVGEYKTMRENTIVCEDAWVALGNAIVLFIVGLIQLDKAAHERKQP